MDVAMVVVADGIVSGVDATGTILGLHVAVFVSAFGLNFIEGLCQVLTPL